MCTHLPPQLHIFQLAAIRLSKSAANKYQARSVSLLVQLRRSKLFHKETSVPETMAVTADMCSQRFVYWINGRGRHFFLALKTMHTLQSHALPSVTHRTRAKHEHLVVRVQHTPSQSVQSNQAAQMENVGCTRKLSQL